MISGSTYSSLIADRINVGTASEALNGDPYAALAITDTLEELQVKIPYKVGKKYLFQLVTLYYVGKVVEADYGYVVLDEASWVHWTGRLSVLMSEQSFTSPKLAQRKPRTEYVGDGVIVHLQAGVVGLPWTGELPVKRSIE